MRRPLRAWRAAALSVVVGLSCAAVRADASPRAVQLAPALGLADVDALAARLLRPFEDPLPVRLSAAAGGHRVLLRHCADWIERRAQVAGSDSDAAWRVVRLQVVDCEALDLLARARGALHSALPGRAAAVMEARQWPATLWPALSRDEAAALQRPGTTLRSASGVVRWQLRPDGVRVLASGERRIELTELARADVDGDGWDDWLLRWEGQMVQGSWTDARLVVLTRRQAAEPLREISGR